jgi:hypothetical protein
VIILGSATLVGSLLRTGLLDVLEIFIVPIPIGAWQRLYETDEQIPLTLTESRPFDNGVLCYATAWHSGALAYEGSGRRFRTGSLVRWPSMIGVDLISLRADTTVAQLSA